MKKHIWFIVIAALVILSVLLGACGGAATEAPSGDTQTGGEDTGGETMEEKEPKHLLF